MKGSITSKSGLRLGQVAFGGRLMGSGWAGRFPDYVPPSVPWEMTEVINNLITYSLYLLKPGGRLVFFLPTDNVSRWQRGGLWCDAPRHRM